MSVPTDHVSAPPAASTPAAHDGTRWIKVIDQTKCIGCHACTTACKQENDVPLSVTRTYVKAVDVGVFPQARRVFQVTRCNQCEDAPCVNACPTGAMYQRSDGIVDFEKTVCIGCKACIAACPYDAIFINPEDHSAEKCNLCSHRIDVGLEPACVVVCPVEAILVGQIDHPSTEAARIVHSEPVTVRRPEKATRPKLFYKGAHQATLDPLAAARPEGGLYMWSEQGGEDWGVGSGAPGRWNSSAAAVLAYDVPHRAPWDWRVGLYTWTKSIAAGTYLVALMLAVAGSITWSSTLWLWVAPLVAGALLGATGLILIWDLEHPRRFPLIFLRPQWRSWLVRGAFVITAYSAILGLHVAMSVAGLASAQRWLALVGGPLAAMAAVYTGYLLAQAKARDLWQSSLLPPHLLVQALVAGSAALLLVALFADAEAVEPLELMLSLAAGAHVLFVVGEITLTHPTAHARVALEELVRGHFARFFGVSIVLVGIAVAAPLIGVVAAPLALMGLLAYEHAYVQAGQAVPLA